jgi:hypothetical protein
MDGRLDVEAKVSEEAGQIGWEGGRGEVERGVVSVCFGHREASLHLSAFFF